MTEKEYIEDWHKLCSEIESVSDLKMFVFVLNRHKKRLVNSAYVLGKFTRDRVVRKIRYFGGKFLLRKMEYPELRKMEYPENEEFYYKFWVKDTFVVFNYKDSKYILYFDEHMYAFMLEEMISF